MKIKLLLALIISAVSAFAKPTEPIPQGHITIDSTPQHADIFVDRTGRAQTPSDLSLPPGKHLISLALPGYKTFYKTITIDNAGRTSLSINLEPLRGIISVKSTPSNAEISIDGISKGKTPTILYDIPLGNHKLVLNAPGYREKTIETKLDDSTPLAINIELSSVTASISFTSNIEDAEVYIQGVPRGTTPITIDNLIPGEVQIEAKAKGYKPLSFTTALTEGSTQNINLTLEKLPGKVTVVSIPDGARVYLDNEYKGTTPITLTSNEEGEHRIRVERQGCDPLARNITLTAGETSTEEFRLKSNTGSILLTTFPDGVTILVDGKEYGKTLPLPDEGKMISAPFRIDDLTKGTHTVKLIRPGYFDQTFEIEVSIGDTTTQSCTLKKKFIPDYEVVTENGRQKGVFIERNQEGIRLETRPGVIKLFLYQDIQSANKLPDSAQ